MAERGFNLLLDQHSSVEETADRIALFKREVEARGRRYDPMQVGVARAFHVATDAADKEAALARRLQARMRQLDIARPPGAVDDGRRFQSHDDTAAGNEASAIYGTPDEMIEKLEALRAVGAGYVLMNGGGSGGGTRARESLRRFAREVMPALSDKPALRVVR